MTRDDYFVMLRDLIAKRDALTALVDSLCGALAVGVLTDPPPGVEKPVPEPLEDSAINKEEIGNEN